MLAINRNYLLCTILLFITEVLIALFVNDSFIRPYLGDVLVVILIYCFVKSFFKIPVVASAIGVLLFSYFIEMLQRFNFVEKIGLKECKIARIVLGSSYEIKDLVAYTIGFGIILMAERSCNKKNSQS